MRMNEQYGLTTENLLRTLPQVLKTDPEMAALAAAIAATLSGRVGEIENLRIYSRIGEVPEEHVQG